MGKTNIIVAREIFFNILLSLYFAFFAWTHLSYFFKTSSLPTLLFVVYETILVFFILFRKLPKEVRFDFKSWLAASIASYLPMLFISDRLEFTGDIVFLLLQIAGITISLLAMLSLNLSFGVVPANRGVKSGGMYKIVRHPIYAGYFISMTCFTIQNIAGYESLIRNCSILVITLVALIIRIKYEEEFLLRDPEYQKLVKTTPYRLIPKIW